MPAQQDEHQRAVFQQQIAIIKKEPVIDYWYGDESGFEGDPIPLWILGLLSWDLIDPVQ